MSIHGNNVIELKERMQPGGVVAAIKSVVLKFATSLGADPTGSGRWNHIDIINETNKVRAITSYQSVKCTYALGIVHRQRNRFFLG